MYCERSGKAGGKNGRAAWNYGIFLVMKAVGKAVAG
jgi:hypothetical protein